MQTLAAAVLVVKTLSKGVSLKAEPVKATTPEEPKIPPPAVQAGALPPQGVRSGQRTDEGLSQGSRSYRRRLPSGGCKETRDRRRRPMLG